MSTTTSSIPFGNYDVEVSFAPTPQGVRAYAMAFAGDETHETRSTHYIDYCRAEIAQAELSTLFPFAFPEVIDDAVSAAGLTCECE